MGSIAFRGSFPLFLEETERSLRDALAQQAAFTRSPRCADSSQVDLTQEDEAAKGYGQPASVPVAAMAEFGGASACRAMSVHARCTGTS